MAINFSILRSKFLILKSVVFITVLFNFSFVTAGEKLKTASNFSPENTFPSPTTTNYFIPALNSLSQPQKLGKFVPVTGNIEQLKYFFKALKNSKNKKIRIAHYGDSLILGDVITEYLREKFQQQYGGIGIGFVPIISDDNRMRRTVNHSFSDDWTYASFVSRNPDQLPFGINGAISIPKPGSWVKYETTRVFKSCSSFDVVKFYYNNADKSSVIQISVDGETPRKINLEAGNDIKELVLSTKSYSTKLEIKFVSGKAPYCYGVSLESNYGIYVDNFPMRGNSGSSLLDIPNKVLQDFDKYLSYDLIIFNYGANVSSPNKGIYNVYENKMVNVIESFKKAFPNTSFLLVSAGDKTIKRGSQFVTDPDVPLLLEAQKKIAEKANIAFWSLWDSMGGLNSMNDWVNAAPPQALKDYSHFTNTGGERVAELFYNALYEVSKNVK